MTPHELAQRYLGQYTTSGQEIKALYCPFCHGGDRRDKNTFALNANTGTFNCARGKCNRRGTFRQLCAEFGEEPDVQFAPTPVPQKQFQRPAVTVKPRTDIAEAYLAKRKISKATMDAYGVGCSEAGDIMFPFTQGGELVFVKYRPARKIGDGERKAWREKDAKPILFGMDLCDKQHPLVIAEGEIDAMSLHEAGVKNAVSVPSGSSDLTWVELCWDWLEQFSEIILCGDMDAPGREMTRKLLDRFGAWRCRVAELPCKDANETLYRHGAEVLVRAVKDAKRPPVAGALELADVQPVNLRTLPRIACNIPYLDRHIGGLRGGELTILTGKRGEGKSTLAGNLLLEAIDQGNSACAYSGELPAEEFRRWLDLQAAGRRNIETYFDHVQNHEAYEIKAETAALIGEWYRGKAFLYDNDKASEHSITDVFTEIFRRHGCQLYLVDNLMIAGYTVSDKDVLRAQARLANDLKGFAKRYKVHVLLVAHPRKQPPKKEASENDFDGDDVAGLGDIVNLCDNLIHLRRMETSTKISVKKSRMFGAPATAAIMKFCAKSKRLYSVEGGADKAYGWEMPDWVRETSQGEVTMA